MANLKQSRKRARQMLRCREHNVSLKSMMQTHIKRTRRLIAEDAGPEKVQAHFKLTASVIDRVAIKGILHKQTAARYKKRLASATKGYCTS